MNTKNGIPKWKDKSKIEKTLTVLGMIVASAIIVLAFLQIFDVWKSENIFVPLLGLLMLIQTLEYRKYNKTSTIICLISTIIIFICYVIMWFI